ncbi:hypothetical protein TWF481_002864 [Arthrobotrys musiformis]|uniref:Uncharacterized protein n=1 Tax=Arthrobotrys musiformis TaxID=47236 RepID=A0AAV9VRM7_9PEZI
MVIQQEMKNNNTKPLAPEAICGQEKFCPKKHPDPEAVWRFVEQIKEALARHPDGHRVRATLPLCMGNNIAQTWKENLL